MRLRLEHGRRDELKTLHPGYFAMVMATGIVSIDTYLHDVPIVPTALLWLNALILAALVVATLARMLRYPQAFADDIRSHSRGVGFFTTVAGIAVFGTQLIVLTDAARVAAVFCIAAAILLALVTYGELAVLTVKPDKPSLADGLNGSWLVSVVAAQSVALLTTLIAGAHVFPGVERPMLFTAQVLWLGGSALYLIIVTLIFFRYTFFPVAPEDITPPYWIGMGAMAISTLAGATLIEHAALSPVVREIKPFVEGITLFFWAIATWWIPMLVVLGIWRHLIGGVPLAYDPLDWGGVFPLGMYSVATYHLTYILDTPFLLPLSQAFMVIALVAWSATIIGFLDTRIGRATRAPPPHQSESRPSSFGL
jgi:tellurite resistance protein TehA-like permease